MAECRVIHPEGLEVELSSGAMTRLAGVSQGLVGSSGIHLAIATIPPGCTSSPHYHVNCESAIYVLAGSGHFVVGGGLSNPCPSDRGISSTSHRTPSTSRSTTARRNPCS